MSSSSTRSVHPAVAGVEAAVHRLTERAVHPRERERDEGEQEEHDRAHPRERDEDGENAAGVVVPAPREVAPVVLLGALER